MTDRESRSISVICQLRQRLYKSVFGVYKISNPGSYHDLYKNQKLSRYLKALIENNKDGQQEDIWIQEHSLFFAHRSSLRAITDTGPL